jgi:hypothetical protein
MHCYTDTNIALHTYTYSLERAITRHAVLRDEGSGCQPYVCMSVIAFMYNIYERLSVSDKQGEIPNIRIMYNDFEHSISTDFDIYICIFQNFGRFIDLFFGYMNFFFENTSFYTTCK